MLHLHEISAIASLVLLLCNRNTNATSVTMVQVNDSFPTMVVAKEAISHFLLNAGASYNVYSTWYILVCKDKGADCSFKI
jgi:hypothetical protein